MSAHPSRDQHFTEALVVLLNRPLYTLVQHLESECVYDCCYMDAFDISAANAGRWLGTVSSDDHRECLRQLDEVLAAVRHTSLSVFMGQLGDFWKRDEALAFLESIKSVVTEALESPNG